ncbi:hypothetical protein, partial [Lysinibacillus xylanilyticus]|uniref:hypothetical protein n=1 Tax=Lysinibacillus xylanilyticus TaxID=582475 RepID=UPI0036DACA0D
MIIIYRNHEGMKVGPESEFRNLPKPRFDEDWYLGIDGSSTSYGLALYTLDYSQIHLFIFRRSNTETAESFRAIMYDWLRNYLHGVEVQAVTYEKTPEGYKPPSDRAGEVMRQTEKAVKTFVNSRNYLLTKSKDYIFDIYPNSWKSYSVPKSRDNLGKVDKELNARAVLESCGLDADKWISGFDRLPYEHDYDCFEALGIGRYGSHFLLQDDGTVKVYKNFSKVGTNIAAAKRIYAESGLGEELPFVGSFGSGKTPRLCSLNENHSIPENLLGLYDPEFNNILIVPKSSQVGIYLDMAFGFELTDDRDYIILGTKTSKT